LAIPELIYAVFVKKEYFPKPDKLKESKITYPSIIKGTYKPRNQAAKLGASQFCHASLRL
jgi:hypothetical protein